MKALICDLCGRITPDVPEASLIEGVTISRGETLVFDGDVCLTCFEKGILGFEPKATAAPEAIVERWEAVEKTSDYFMEALRGDAEAGKVAPEAISTTPTDQGPEVYFTKEKVEETTAQIIDHIEEIVGGKVVHCHPTPDYKVICKQCGNPFEARSERSTFCSKKCVNQDYKAKQKTARTPEVDALMKKLKAENPVPVKRGSSHYDFA